MIYDQCFAHVLLSVFNCCMLCVLTFVLACILFHEGFDAFQYNFFNRTYKECTMGSNVINIHIFNACVKEKLQIVDTRYNFDYVYIKAVHIDVS